MKSTFQSPMGVSLRDDRGRLLEADVIELADEDLNFDEAWDDIFVSMAGETSAHDEISSRITLTNEVVWMDELPTGRYPAVLPSWVEAELRSSEKLAS